MTNKAVRMHAQNDLRLDTFELPEIRDDEILVKIISDSICMSSYKAAIQGTHHKRVPDDIAEHPPIIGHEFCGVIEQVGAKWADRFAPGEKFVIQPAITYHGTQMTPGYAFEYCGGDSQYAILIPEIMEQNCLLEYRAKEYFYGSLSEPLSCIIGTFHAMYHTKPGVYTHEMGIREGGNMAILAGAGPMGLGAIDYAIHCDRRPGLLVVTDINQARLDRAASIYTVEDAARHGVRLVYLNTSENAVDKLKEVSGGAGYDDVLVFAPVPAVIEQGDAILGFDGCLNFFAGPTNPKLSANFNFYDVQRTPPRRHLRRQYGRHARGAAHDRRGQAEPGRHDHARRRTERRRGDDAQPALRPRRQEAHLHAHHHGADRHRGLCQEGRNRPDVQAPRRNLSGEQQPLVRRGRGLSAGARAGNLSITATLRGRKQHGCFLPHSFTRMRF